MDMKTTNKSFVRHYFFNGISKCSQTFIVSIILHLISFPITLGVYTYAEHENSLTMHEVTSVFLVLSVIFTGLAVLAGIMNVLGNFSYLHKKHEADTYYSLPLSNGQRFWCDYLSGLFCYIVPVIIAQIVSFGVSLVTMGLLPETRCVNDDYSINIAKVVLMVYALGIVLMIMFYTISVLACVLCGSIFESLLSTVLLNCAVPGLILLVSFICFNRVYSVDWGEMILPVLAKTSPFGGGFVFVYYLDLLQEELFHTGYFLKYISWIIFFSIVYATLSFLLYKKRKAESVSKPYVFKGYYYALITAITFSICAIIPVSFETLVVPIVMVAMVEYMIFEVIANRGFKKVKFSIIRSVVTICCSIFVICILNNSWGFGIITQIPDEDKIKSVEFGYFSASQYAYDYYSDSGFEYTDKENIDLITTAHKNSVKDITFKKLLKDFSLNYYDNSEYYTFDYYNKRSYKVVYKMNNGKIITRHIYLDSSDIYDLCKLETTEEYVENVISYVDLMSNLQYSSLGFSNMTTRYWLDNYDISYDGEYQNTSSVFKNFSAEITTALKTDLSKRTLEQIRNPQNMYGVFEEFIIFDSDENVIRVLEKYKSVMESYDYNMTYLYEDEEGNSQYTEAPIFVRLVANGNFTEDLTNLGIMNENTEYYRCDAYYGNSEIMELEEKIMSALVPYTFDENIKYAVCLDNSSFNCWMYVPTRFNADVEQLIAYAKENTDKSDNYGYDYSLGYWD